MSISGPSISAIKQLRTELGDKIVTTPVWQACSDRLAQQIGKATQILLKLELFQMTGTFKARGALATLLHAKPNQLQNGVVAASGGNHAIAVSYAAKTLATSAKVIMPATASPIRQQRCREYGAEVLLVGNMGEALDLMQTIAKEERRLPIHPFEGQEIVLGTGTLGLELMEQVSDLEAILVPVGGGGLISGLANAVKQIAPRCKIYGIEPQGADSMYQSMQAGKPVSATNVDTIADSLAAPASLPYSFGLAQQFVDEVVLVSDDELKRAMITMFYETKLAVEPAAAAALAGLTGPLLSKLRGKKVALIVCGANLDIDRFYQLVENML